MRVYRDVHCAELQQPCVLAIGNFDGVHCGHQALLQRLQALAQAQAQHGHTLKRRVLSFDPHPREYFAQLLAKPHLTPARITTLRDRLSALACAGIDEVVVLPFNAALATLRADDFVQHMLLGQLATRHLWVGADFRFGAQRQGDVALLQSYAPKLQVHVLATVLQGSERVSSSALRQAFAAGDMPHVRALLGRPWSLSGHVVHGRKLGRTLGAPTLNQRFGRGLPPAMGVFVARVHGLGAEPLPAVSSLGVRPSLDAHDTNGGQVLLESHCLQWPPDLGPEGAYGKCIRTELLHWLHAERSYPGLQALQAGIHDDVQAARAWLQRQDACCAA